LENYNGLVWLSTSCPRKKDATDFLLKLLQILTDFYNFSCTTSPENARVIGVRISCHTFVMLLPYRVNCQTQK